MLSPYVTIDVTAKSILVLPPDESVQIPDGFMETTIQLNGTYKVQGWVWKSDEQQKYCVEMCIRDRIRACKKRKRS